MPINYDIEYPKLMKGYQERGRRIAELEAENAEWEQRNNDLYITNGNQTDALEARDKRIAELEEQLLGVGSIHMEARIAELEAELEDETYRYKWLKSELRTNAKVIGEQQDQIAELTAALGKVEVMATHTGDVNIQRVAREALAAVEEKKR